MTATATASAPERMEIVTTERQLDAVVDDGIRALRQVNDPPTLFMRGGQVVTVAPDEDARPTIRIVNSEALLDRLSEAARWFRFGKKGDLKDCGPGRTVAVTVLQRFQREPTLLPPLRRIVLSPVMRPDGSILDRPGYDPATRLVYSPIDDVQVPAIPETPTATDLELATAAIEEVLADFPFKSDADRATAWALLVGILLREVIDGHMPLTAITSPTQGTGKGLVVDVVCTIATGRQAAVSAMPDSRGDDEMRKRITTSLLAGRSVAVLDNVTRPIDSAALAAAITGDRWTDRQLGSNTEIDLPNRCTWIATGNNVVVRGDFIRRVVWCRLDAEVARPWLREGFRHPDLLEYVSEHRGELLAAVLTLARGWVVARRPEPSEDVPVLGGFQAWRRVVGGVLRVAGIEGLLGQAAEMLDEADEETPAWAAFVAAWRDRWGESPITVAELVRTLRGEQESEIPTDLVQALPTELVDMLGTKKAGVPISHAIRQHADRRFETDAGLCWLSKAGKDGHTKAVRWRVRCG